jgi:hypothetical protein
MENSTDLKYYALPGRLYLIGRDGREWRIAAHQIRLALWHRSWNARSKNTSRPLQSRRRRLNAESLAGH